MTEPSPRRFVRPTRRIALVGLLVVLAMSAVGVTIGLAAGDRSRTRLHSWGAGAGCEARRGDGS